MHPDLPEDPKGVGELHNSPSSIWRSVPSNLVICGEYLQMRWFQTTDVTQSGLLLGAVGYWPMAYLREVHSTYDSTVCTYTVVVYMRG